MQNLRRRERQTGLRSNDLPFGKLCSEEIFVYSFLDFQSRPVPKAFYPIPPLASHQVYLEVTVPFAG